MKCTTRSSTFRILSIVFMLISITQTAVLYAQTREAVVAGAFYPHRAEDLRKMIGGYIKDAERKEIAGELRVLIAPHAGYIYSGPVAAEGYKLLEDKTYKTVVVIALSHHYPFKGASIYDGEFYKTPLGPIKLNKAFIQQLNESPLINYHRLAHTREHSLEVHLPFLQYMLKDEFQLVPIILGDVSHETAQTVANGLATLADSDDFLVVVSTDLSHFNPYEVARAKDIETIENIVNKSDTELQKYFEEKPDAACGRCPLVTALIYASKIGANNRHVLAYANSGDTAGDKNKVVGYVSIAISKGKENDMTAQKGTSLFSENAKQELINLVRQTIREYLQSGKIESAKIDHPELQSENGAFVTLHSKNGSLRGCIGNFVSHEPLYKTIREMAISSAFRDPRFPSVTIDELDELKVEISVLSPMEKIEDVGQIELGVHGIYIKKGFHSGTFLPQVATETGWTLEEFLGHCARDKAGIGWDGWKDANIYIYTADVFGEE